MRTSRFSSRPPRLTRISSCTNSRAPIAQSLEECRELRHRDRQARRLLAAVLELQEPLGGAVDEGRHVPSASSPTTPAVTEDSTESNRRRRRSICRLWPEASSRCAFSCRVIWLKIRPSSRSRRRQPPRGPARRDRPPRPAAPRPPVAPPAATGARRTRAQPDRRKDQDHGKAQIEQPELEQDAPALILKLVVEPHRFLRVVEKREDLTVDIAGDVEIPVGETFQRDQRAEFVVDPNPR